MTGDNWARAVTYDGNHYFVEASARGQRFALLPEEARSFASQLESAAYEADEAQGY